MIVELAAGGGPPGGLLWVLSIIGTSGIVAVAWQAYLRWKRGGTEDEELVSRISQQVSAGASKLLDEYRIELEVAQRQIRLYLDQVTELNRLLGSANERIDRLERQLIERRDERRELTRQLREAMKRREEVVEEIRKLRGRVEELEDRLQLPEEERHRLPDDIDGLASHRRPTRSD